jgi:hypothetical protein
MGAATDRARRTAGQLRTQRFPKGLREAVVFISVFTRSGLRGRSARLAAAAAVTAASFIAAGCGSETVRQGQASSYLVIENLEGASGAESSSIFDHVLRSDVQTRGGVFEDNGRVRMSMAMKDVTNPNGPTSNNSITVNRYRVDFRRTDGRNAQGVDVPYAFDGAVTFTVNPGQSVAIPFTLVRVQSKLEAPLSALAQLGGGVVISTIADVTFFGRDQTGREVSVAGSISVNFADWADPD